MVVGKGIMLGTRSPQLTPDRLALATYAAPIMAVGCTLQDPSATVGTSCLGFGHDEQLPPPNW
jgi:hypothetical protein